MVSDDSTDAEHRPHDGGEPDESGSVPVPGSGRKARGAAATVLGAAMIAVGEILEPEKAGVEIVQPADDTGPEGLLGLFDFGDLPPLD